MIVLGCCLRGNFFLNPLLEAIEPYFAVTVFLAISFYHDLLLLFMEYFFNAKIIFRHFLLRLELNFIPASIFIDIICRSRAVGCTKKGFGREWEADGNDVVDGL